MLFRSLSNDEWIHLYDMLGYVYYAKGEYSQAIDSYQKLLALSNVPGSKRAAAYRFIAQLSQHQKEWLQSATAYERYIALVKSPEPEDYQWLAWSCYQLERFEESLKNSSTALAMHDAGGTVLDKLLYDIQRAFHHREGNLAQAEALVRQSLKHYPNEQDEAMLAKLVAMRSGNSGTHSAGARE